MSKRISACVVAAVAGLGVISSAGAQGFLELEQAPQFVGLGVGAAPDFRGSDDYEGGIAPYFRYTFAGQERFVQLFANELSLNLLNSRTYRLGPVLNYHFGRDDNVEDVVVRQMAKIDDTVEAGVFGDIAWIDDANPRNRFILGATLLQDVGDESDGLRVRVSARYWRQVATAVDLHLGGGFVYADDDYMNHYFGVNAGNVGTSGLPVFTAGGGMQEYFLSAGTAVYLSREWVLGAGVRYSRLTGDAADSSIVTLRGDKNQWVGGIGIAYIWR